MTEDTRIELLEDTVKNLVDAITTMTSMIKILKDRIDKLEKEK